MSNHMVEMRKCLQDVLPEMQDPTEARQLFGGLESCSFQPLSWYVVVCTQAIIHVLKLRRVNSHVYTVTIKDFVNFTACISPGAENSL